jgi:hypothetical protein
MCLLEAGITASLFSVAFLYKKNKYISLVESKNISPQLFSSIDVYKLDVLSSMSV